MTVSLMAYGSVMGLLLGGAAYLMDRSLRALGRPTRWIWMGAIFMVIGGVTAALDRRYRKLRARDRQRQATQEGLTARPQTV